MKRLGAALILLAASTLSAAVPNRITYQGRLTKSGVTMAGSHTFHACLKPSAGLPACKDYSLNLPPSGDFTLLIDVPPALDWINGAVQLELTVDGHAMTPPDDFTAVPYALVAATATSVNADDVRLQNASKDLSSWQSPSNPDLINPAKIQNPFPDPVSMKNGLAMNNTKITALAPATNPDEAVRLDQMTSTLVLPPGTILPFGGVSAPPGFLLCDGAAVSRTTYSNLFIAIGSTWGPGDGSTTFNLPDLRGRSLFGKAPSGTFGNLGETGGTETHTHTQAPHSHTVAPHTHSISMDGAHSHSLMNGNGPVGIGSFKLASTTTAGSHNHTGSTGSASPSTDSQAPVINPANNLPPFAVINYIIKS